MFMNNCNNLGPLRMSLYVILLVVPRTEPCGTPNFSFVCLGIHHLRLQTDNDRSNKTRARKEASPATLSNVYKNIVIYVIKSYTKIKEHKQGDTDQIPVVGHLPL